MSDTEEALQAAADRAADDQENAYTQGRPAPMTRAAQNQLLASDKEPTADRPDRNLPRSSTDEHAWYRYHDRQVDGSRHALGDDPPDSADAHDCDSA